MMARVGRDSRVMPAARMRAWCVVSWRLYVSTGDLLHSAEDDATRSHYLMSYHIYIALCVSTGDPLHGGEDSRRGRGGGTW